MALTAAQLCTLACQIAKCPGFTAQAGQLLNSILSDLAETYDFDVRRKTFNFNLTAGINGTDTGSGPYTLPEDYLRARYNEVFYTIQGVPYVLINIDLNEYDRLVQQAGLASYPYFFATDMSPVLDGDPPVMYVWPPSSGTYPMTVRYQSSSPDIATPESSSEVPWFPNRDYLQQKLSEQLMLITNDSRQESFRRQTDDQLSAYLKMKDDPEGRAQTVKLDRRTFRPGAQSLRNTKTIGWTLVFATFLPSIIERILGA